MAVTATRPPFADVVAYRPRLLMIAYRMLGTLSDAEEIVQEAFLRLHATVPRKIDNAEAWLVAVTTRLSIDRYRRLRRERLRYVGPWLPEPWIDEATAASPESEVEAASELSYGLLLLLERLTAPERAAFLLHDVFDHDYDEVAQMLRKSPAACRQLVHRARVRVAHARKRFDTDAATHRALLAGFLEAVRRRDLDALLALLAPDAVFYADGGGKVQAAGKPLNGARAVSRFIIGVSKQQADDVWGEVVRVDGNVGIALLIGRELMSVLMIESENRRIAALFSVANPAKLVRTRSLLSRVAALHAAEDGTHAAGRATGSR